MSALESRPVARKKKGSGEAGLLGALGAIVIIGGGLFFFLSKMNEPPTPPKPPIMPSTQEMFDTLVKNVRHERGLKTAPITIIEFGDLECPPCRRAYNDVLKKYEKRSDIRFIFYNKPLVSRHEHALAAAMSLEAAANQGQFWPMFDALFTGEEPKLATANIEAAAQKIGLEMERFRKDAKSDVAKTAVEKDAAISDKYGIDTTPTFVVRRSDSKTVLQVTGGGELKTAIENPKAAGFYKTPTPQAAGR